MKILLFVAVLGILISLGVLVAVIGRARAQERKDKEQGQGPRARNAGPN